MLFAIWPAFFCSTLLPQVSLNEVLAVGHTRRHADLGARFEQPQPRLAKVAAPFTRCWGCVLLLGQDHDIELAFKQADLALGKFLLPLEQQGFLQLLLHEGTMQFFFTAPQLLLPAPHLLQRIFHNCTLTMMSFMQQTTMNSGTVINKVLFAVDSAHILCIEALWRTVPISHS